MKGNLKFKNKTKETKENKHESQRIKNNYI